MRFKSILIPRKVTFDSNQWIPNQILPQHYSLIILPLGHTVDPMPRRPPSAAANRSVTRSTRRTCWLWRRRRCGWAESCCRWQASEWRKGDITTDDKKDSWIGTEWALLVEEKGFVDSDIIYFPYYTNTHLNICRAQLGANHFLFRLCSNLGSLHAGQRAV